MELSSILGYPNVGKSSLMNGLVGKKVRFLAYNWILTVFSMAIFASKINLHDAVKFGVWFWLSEGHVKVHVYNCLET